MLFICGQFGFLLLRSIYSYVFVIFGLSFLILCCILWVIYILWITIFVIWKMYKYLLIARLIVCFCGSFFYLIFMFYFSWCVCCFGVTHSGDHHDLTSGSVLIDHFWQNLGGLYVVLGVNARWTAYKASTLSSVPFQCCIFLI